MLQAKGLQKKHCDRKKYFPKFVPFMRLSGNIQWRQTGHVRQYNTTQKSCASLLYNKGYRHSLRRASAAARLLRLWVQIPPWHGRCLL